MNREVTETVVLELCEWLNERVGGEAEVWCEVFGTLLPALARRLNSLALTPAEARHEERVLMQIIDRLSRQQLTAGLWFTLGCACIGLSYGPEESQTHREQAER